MQRERPNYRLRVFLSVDLSGSTAFKSKEKSTNWIRTFRKFYADFLKHYKAIYIEFCGTHTECQKYNLDGYFPKLWKTVGDEAIFVNRVESQFHLFAYVHAFDGALKRYKEVLHSTPETNSLDVKGNGWIASFPTPNQTVSLENANGPGFEDEIPDESIEAQADKHPSQFDFLGPGIDAGFRISGNSTSGFFTVSPMLAWLLCRANTNRLYEKFKFELEFRGVNELKGVIGEAPYPIIGLNTERDEKLKKINRLQNKMLGGVETDANLLIDYLEEFASLYKVDMPSITTGENDAGFAVPEFYTQTFVPEWKKLDEAFAARDKNLQESVAENGGDEDQTSKPIEDHWEILKAILEKIAKN